MTEDLRALADDAIASSRAGEDPDYPLVHVAPPVGRLNDPNGLLVDAGTYHAFYQFTPLHGTRRLVYWGHSSSTDLLHWRHRGVAVVPDSPYDASGAYSGSALVLEGAEVGAAPARAPYQLFYTGNLKDPVTDERTASQCLVTSADLDDFVKWPANPLIADHAPGYTAHYRDPQVSRDPERPGAYRMLIGVQRADETGAAVLYRSRDLLTWEPAGEITFPDAGGALDDFGFMWECPGLVTLTDEVTGLERDVLIWCPQGARPAGEEGYENVFPCVYAVGRLVGTELRECDGTVREVDRGFEFYAPQAFARRPGEPGPVLLTGWAGNAGEDDQPSIATGGWVHALTAARALSLRDGRLIQRPAPALPSSTATAPGTWSWASRSWARAPRWDCASATTPPSCRCACAARPRARSWSWTAPPRATPATAPGARSACPPGRPGAWRSSTTAPSRRSSWATATSPSPCAASWRPTPAAPSWWPTDRCAWAGSRPSTSTEARRARPDAERGP